MSDNPYLAHQASNNGGGSSGASPLDGWIPRKVDGKQVVKAMVRLLLRFLYMTCFFSLSS